MNRLLEVLAIKASDLGDIELPNAEETKFLGAFLNVYNIDDIDIRQEVIGFTGYLGAVLCTYNINMPFEEMYENLQYLKPILDYYDFDFETFEKYLDALKRLNDLNLLCEVSPNAKGLDRQTKANYKKCHLLKYDRKLFTLPNGEYDECASLAMIKLFKALPDPDKFKSYVEVLALKMCISDTVQSYEHDFAIFKGTRTMNRMIDKERDKVVRSVVRDYVKDNGLKVYEYYEDIKHHYQTLYKNVQSVIKEANRKIAKLESLDRKISSIPKHERIKLSSDIEKMLIDADVEYAYLLFALKHNLDIFIPVEDKNIEYNNNSITKMEILFTKYGYNFNMFSESMQKEIIKRGIENVESILKQIKYSNLSFITEGTELFFNVIIRSNPSIIKFLDMGFKNKLITKDFILQNQALLYNLELFNQFFNNFNYFVSLGIKLDVKGIDSVLLLDSNYLIGQLNILGEYGLNVSANNFSNVDILKNYRLLDVLDNFIELGYGKIVLDNPKYLTSGSQDMVKRIMIAKMIGLPPTNSQNKFIGSITTGNNFYVEPKEYDKFIIDYKEDYQNPRVLEVLNNSSRTVISASTKNLPIIQALDERFMKSTNCYEINGVLISRMRVMRNLEVLTKDKELLNISLYDLLFQAIIYNMIPNVEAEKLTQIYNTVCSIEVDFSKVYTMN